LHKRRDVNSTGLTELFAFGQNWRFAKQSEAARESRPPTVADSIPAGYDILAGHDFQQGYNAGLSKVTMPDTRYSIIGIRADGSREVIVDGISQTVANKVATEISSVAFEKIVIEPSGPIQPAPFNDRQSAVLFPPDDQPGE
jgi:hypothetical protein